MTTIPVMGVDAAFANMGLAYGWLTINGSNVALDVTQLRLVKTAGDDKKVVRKSSSDLRRGQELCSALAAAMNYWTPIFVFAEVPQGAQSAAAARALGIAVGVLASCSVRITEVSPLEVKRVVMGMSKQRKGPSKNDMIAWATKRWPKAGWLLHRGDYMADNEHLADACAVIEAGIRTPEFQNVLRMLVQRQSSRRRLA